MCDCFNLWLLEISCSSNHSCSLAIFKKQPIVDDKKPMHTKCQFMVLPGSGEVANPYDVLHSYIHNIVSPYFNSFVEFKEEANNSSLSKEDTSLKLGIFIYLF